MELTSAVWRLIGARVTGTRHRRQGRGCEDFAQMEVVPGRAVIAVVADGAGSAAQAARGAELAATAAASWIRQCLLRLPAEPEEAFLRDLLVQAMQHAYDAIYYQNTLHRALQGEPPQVFPGDLVQGNEATPVADSPPATMRAYATTLLLAVMTGRWAAFAQIGDGAIVAARTGGELELVLAPAAGEYLNETDFLTETDYLARLNLRTLPAPEIAALALMSDGVQWLAIDHANQQPHEGFFAPIFAFVAQPEANAEALETFLDSERVNARTDDDKTLIVAVRRQEANG